MGIVAGQSGRGGFPAVTPAPLWGALARPPTLSPPPPPQALLNIPTQLMSSGKHRQTDVQDFAKGFTDQYWFHELGVDHHNDSHLLQQRISRLPIGASGSRHTSASVLLSVTLKSTWEHTPLDAPFPTSAQACSPQILT